MGIPGLWNALTPAGELVSLHHLTVERGFVENISNTRSFRVGIDASGLMFSACARHSRTKNPELATLFSQCSRLLQLPIKPLFAFDGSGRPKIKRGKAVRGNDHWLTHGFKEMLRAFGFPYIQAPGEAEAELAWISRAGLLDAIMTEDSDALVFGASAVLRIRPENRETSQAMLYTANAIATHTDTRLETIDMVVIALLAGGDYSPGLPDCGINIALKIVRAGFGASLIAGITGKSVEAATAFLRAWRAELVTELRTNSLNCFLHPRPALASRIPSDFPNLAIINLYIHPLTSDQTLDILASVTWPGPQPGFLASFAEDNFVWGHTTGILAHFSTTIFPGMAIQQLVHGATSLDNGNPIAECPMLDRIVFQRKSPSTCFLSEVRVKLVVPRTVVDEILNSVVGKLSTPETVSMTTSWIESDFTRLRAWLPYDMVKIVCPDLLADFIGTALSGPEGTHLPTFGEASGSQETQVMRSRRSEASSTSSVKKVQIKHETTRREKRYKITVVQSPQGEVLEFFSETESDSDMDV